MAVLDWMTPDAAHTLRGAGVRLRPPRMADYAEWAQLRHASHAFLQPWEPTWPEDDLSRPAFRRRLSVYARDADSGLGFAFFVFREAGSYGPGGELVGGVNLRDVRRGVSQSGAIGYWAGAPYAGRGHIGAAVRAVTEFAFGRLGLNRLEAACVPENAPSRALLESAGFAYEGRARAYLKINGSWRDHLLFGRIRPGGGNGAA